MRTILVDDEINAMEFFRLECANIEDIQIVASFDSPLAALEYAKAQPVDLAILDIAMPGMSGIELGRRLKELNPDIILVYISAHDEYAMAAYQLRAPAYLEKPYNREDVIYALETAKLLSRRTTGQAAPAKAVFIRTFGYFDVFVNDQLLYFRNKKSKELLAYLVNCKGNAVTNGQAITALWEDAVNDLKYQSKFRRVVKDLRDALQQAGIEHILISRSNCRAVDVKAFDCDYFWLLDGKTEAMHLFNGAYMAEYSWAEETVAYLTHLQSMALGETP